MIKKVVSLTSPSIFLEQWTQFCLILLHLLLGVFKHAFKNHEQVEEGPLTFNIFKFLKKREKEKIHESYIQYRKISTRDKTGSTKQPTTAVLISINQNNDYNTLPLFLRHGSTSFPCLLQLCHTHHAEIF